MIKTAGEGASSYPALRSRRSGCSPAASPAPVRSFGFSRCWTFRYRVRFFWVHGSKLNMLVTFSLKHVEVRLKKSPCETCLGVSAWRQT